MTSMMNRARQGKHAAAMLQRAGKARAEALTDELRTRRAARNGRSFDAKAHREKDGQFAVDYFLNRVDDTRRSADLPAPRRIFVAWTDSNVMTPNRVAGVEAIRQMNPDVEVVLVEPSNLHEWVVEGHPLHPSYEHLSAVHRSDYLRAYLMHHHGGAWSDIKRPTNGWRPLFDIINADAAIWLLGYPEARSRDVAFLDSALGREMADKYRTIAANCAFIMRPQTPFTAAWLEEVESRLDYYARSLARHPAADPFGEQGAYPLPWSALQGLVFQPLQLRYTAHVLFDERLRPAAADHR